MDSLTLLREEAIMLRGEAMFHREKAQERRYKRHALLASDCECEAAQWEAAASELETLRVKVAELEARLVPPVSDLAEVCGWAQAWLDNHWPRRHPERDKRLEILARVRDSLTKKED